MRGQFTQYLLSQPDSSQSTVDVAVQVKVIENKGRAATLSIPYAGKLRIFPDYVQMTHEPTLAAHLSSGQ
jgi:hypothetical protein